MGANDSNFTLRRDAALMVRRKGVENTVFASIVEPHGNYSPVSEIAVNSNSNIAKLRVVYDESDYTAVSIEDMEGRTSIFILSNMDLITTQAKRNLSSRSGIGGVRSAT